MASQWAEKKENRAAVLRAIQTHLEKIGARAILHHDLIRIVAELMNPGRPRPLLVEPVIDALVEAGELRCWGAAGNYTYAIHTRGTAFTEDEETDLEQPPEVASSAPEPAADPVRDSPVDVPTVPAEDRESLSKHPHPEYLRLRNLLVQRAREAALRASSYRNFRVGCAVLARRCEPSEEETYGIFLGANMKPLEDGPKVCAEQIAVGAARAEGYQHIVALVVAGEPQVDAHSGHTPETLHPCWLCRTLLAELPEVRPDTIILTVHNHGGVSEEHTFQELLELH